MVYSVYLKIGGAVELHMIMMSRTVYVVVDLEYYFLQKVRMKSLSLSLSLDIFIAYCRNGIRNIRAIRWSIDSQLLCSQQ